MMITHIIIPLYPLGPLYIAEFVLWIILTCDFRLFCQALSSNYSPRWQTYVIPHRHRYNVPSDSSLVQPSALLTTANSQPPLIVAPQQSSSSASPRRAVLHNNLRHLLPMVHALQQRAVVDVSPSTQEGASLETHVSEAQSVSANATVTEDPSLPSALHIGGITLIDSASKGENISSSTYRNITATVEKHAPGIVFPLHSVE